MVNKKVSIIDVARKAGVSTATISRVINGNGGYSKETERKVRQTIEECGYIPNVSAASLRTNRSKCIGVIVPDITNEFFAKIVHELDIFLVSGGYSLLICDSNEDYDLEDTYIKNLIEKSVDGIIYISGQNEIKNIADVRNIPVVYIDRAPQNAEVLILSDNENGGYLATKELLKKGCRRILFLRDLRYASTIRQRKRGYLKALKEYGVEYDEGLEISCFPDYDDAKRTMDLLFNAKGCFFDGIFATNDKMALACINVLKKNGMHVPQDVKVVGFDNISIAEFANPTITTISQDTKKIAQNAGNTVLKMIQQKKIVNKQKIIPVTLVCRRSTQAGTGDAE